MELGGKNAQIVMDDADLELALEGALWGAFGTTGQRCTATSRLIVHKKIADKFIAELVQRPVKFVLEMDWMNLRKWVRLLIRFKETKFKNILK